MEQKNPHIAIILGTRAELIKTFPIMLELKNQKRHYLFIHSGQHSLGGLCKKLGVKKPDIVLNIEPEKSSFNSKEGKAILWNLGLIFKIKKVLKNFPDIKYVIYHGDTMTTASAAIACSIILDPFKKFKSVHLEAGLRSFNNREPFPEEISRRIAGKFSDILFAVSKNAKKNLKSKKSVVLIGNTILDSVNFSIKKAEQQKVKPLEKGKFALVSIHRHENIKSKKRLQQIVEILSSLKVPSYFTLHTNTEKKLKEFNLYSKLKENKNIKILTPMDYVSYVYQISKCALVICDGGSLQEESLIFQKPCIILRNATERPEGLESNFQYLSKFDVEKTKEKIKYFLSPSFKVKKFENPYGSIGVSKKVVEILK